MTIIQLESKKRRKRRKKKQRFIAKAILPLLLFVIGCIYYFFFSSMSDELESTTAQEETKKTVQVQPKPSPVDDLPKTLTLETSQGNIVIELRPNQALESVQYIKKLLDSPKPCKGCRFYRAEQRGILQGILHKEDVPANEVLGKCPDDVEETEKCHGPMMKKGMVGWAAGEGGPDFFIDNYDRLADWWGHDHTVWGEITDAESLKVVDSFFDLPRTKRGLTYLDTHVPITMK